MYEINWEAEYEPYIIADKEALPLWDERFVGYGFDKVQHIAELHFAGFKFMVLPEVYVIHLDHGVPPWRGRSDNVPCCERSS